MLPPLDGPGNFM